MPLWRRVALARPAPASPRARLRAALEAHARSFGEVQLRVTTGVRGNRLVAAAVEIVLGIKVV
jgi:hypothetical protein